MEVTCLLTLLGLCAVLSAGYCAGLNAGDPCPSPNRTSPDGTHCPVYYFCGHSPHQIWMKRFCVYPQVFSISSHTCDEYEAVDCSSRGVPFTPCEYIPQCQHHEAGTCFCKGHISYGDVDWAFCIGKTNGYYPYTTRLSTPYYIQCKDNRTVPSTCGEGLIFDQFDMICRGERSLTPSMVMNATLTSLTSIEAKSGGRYMTSYPVTAPIFNSTTTSHTGQFTRNLVTENYESISTVFKGSQYMLTTNQIDHSTLQTTPTANTENEKQTKSSLRYQSDILSGNPLENTQSTIYKTSQITTLNYTFNQYSTTILTPRPTQSSIEIKTTLNSVQHIPSIIFGIKVLSSDEITLEMTDIMLASSRNALTSVDIDRTLNPTKISFFSWSSSTESYTALVSTAMGTPVDAETSILVSDIQTETPRMHQTELFTSAVAETAIVANSGKPTVIMSDLAVPSSIEVGSKIRTAVLSESIIPMISNSDITTFMTSDSEMPVAISEFKMPTLLVSDSEITSSIVHNSIMPTLLVSDSEITPSIGHDSIMPTLLVSDSEIKPSIVHDSIMPTLLVSDSETTPSIGHDSIMPTLLVSDSEIKPSIVHDSIMPTLLVSDSETTPSIGHDSIMPSLLMSDSETTPSIGHDSIMPTLLVSDSEIMSSMVSNSVMPSAIVSHFIDQTTIMATSEIPITVLSGSERTTSFVSDSEITSMLSGSEILTAVMHSSGVPTSVHSDYTSIVPDSIIHKSNSSYSKLPIVIVSGSIRLTANVSYSERFIAVATKSKIPSETSTAMPTGRGSYTDISTSTVSVFEFPIPTAIASKSFEMSSSTLSDSVMPTVMSTDSEMSEALKYASNNDISPSTNLLYPVTARSEEAETQVPISLSEKGILHPSLSNYYKWSTAIDETFQRSPYESEIITQHTTKITGSEIYHSMDTEVETSVTSSQSSTSIGGVQSSRMSRHLDTKSAGSDFSPHMSSSLTNLRIPGESMMTSRRIHSTPPGASTNMPLPISAEMVQLATSNNQKSLLSLENEYANTNLEQLITTKAIQTQTSIHQNSKPSIANQSTNSEMDALKTPEIMQGASLDKSSSHCSNLNVRPYKTSESYQPSETVKVVTTSGPTSVLPSSLHTTTRTDPQHTSEHPNNVSVVVAGVAGGVILAAAMTILTLIIKGLQGKKESLTITNPDNVKADININPLLNQKEADLIY